MREKGSISGELDLIGRIRDRFRGIRSRGVALGIGDDCAVLRPPPGSEILVTTDMSHERRHFRPGPPFAGVCRASHAGAGPE